MMKMAENLPDEIWIIILGFVPLRDRLKNVQFVCKRLHLLCWDPVLNTYLNFSSWNSLSDLSCQTYIRTMKKSVKSLAFQDCHWFSRHFFSTLPFMPSLKSIDLTGCCLKGHELATLLKMMPNLEHLAISIRSLEFRYYMAGVFQPKALPNKLNLKTLHIEFMGAVGMHADISSNIAQHFVAESQKPESFSFNCISPTKSFAKLYMIPSKFTLDYGCDLDLRTSVDCRAFCTAFLCANLHGPRIDGGLSNYLPRYTLSNIRFLSLPNVRWLNWAVRTCNEAKCPSTLANLECLVMPIMNCKDGSCYYALKRDLLLACSFPKLKCLKVVGQWEPIPPDFYHRISLLTNLTDLNLMGVEVDIEILLNSIKELKNLRSLSFSPTCVSRESSRGGAEEDANSKKELSLVDVAPNLTKFEMSRESVDHAAWTSSYCGTLHTLGKLKKLRKLSLRSIGLAESYSKVLREYTTLTSLCLSSCGGDSKCIYPTLLQGVLRTLPNLLELRLQHTKLRFGTKLCAEICECKKIEKVVLSSLPTDSAMTTAWSDVDYLASPRHLSHLASLIHSNCHNLHVFIFAVEFSKLWYKHWNSYKSKFIADDTRLIFECGYPLLFPDVKYPFWHKLIDFSKSHIFDYNPFNFPYSHDSRSS